MFLSRLGERKLPRIETCFQNYFRVFGRVFSRQKSKTDSGFEAGFEARLEFRLVGLEAKGPRHILNSEASKSTSAGGAHRSDRRRPEGPKAVQSDSRHTSTNFRKISKIYANNKPKNILGTPMCRSFGRIKYTF